MFKHRLSDTKFMGVLRQVGGSALALELCCKHRIDTASFYSWRTKFDGMDASMMTEIKVTAEEYHRLKRIYGEMSMQVDLQIKQ